MKILKGRVVILLKNKKFYGKKRFYFY